MLRGADFASLCSGALLAWLGATACARKAPAVLCSCSYGGAEQRLMFPATRDPYQVKAIDRLAHALLRARRVKRRALPATAPLKKAPSVAFGVPFAGWQERGP